MRRHISYLLIVMIGAIGLLSSGMAAGQDDPPTEHEPIRVAPAPGAPPLFGPLQGVWSDAVDVELQEVPDPLLTQSHASDSCGDAPPMGLQTFGTAGDVSLVNDMTVVDSDPVLTCMWGNPSSPRGWRTVWYKFVAPVSGHLAVNTSFEASDFGDSYDTVLGLYQSADGTCGSLTMLGCDDDSNGFYSEITAFVIEGRTYYIEVADWNFAVLGEATLRLSVVLEEGDTLWQRFDRNESGWTTPRSRHSIVSDGRFIYLVGGESEVDFPQPQGVTDRFDTLTRTWVDKGLRPLPRPYYSRTSAVLLGGRIYVPSGYAGNNQAYLGEHWVYDIATDRWDEGADAPWGTPSGSCPQASPSGAAYAWHQAVSSPTDNGYFVTGGLLEGDPDQLVPPINIAPTSRLLFYNAGNATWNQCLPDMETARFAHVAALLNTPQGRQVCVAGGLTRLERDPEEDLAAVVSNVECYNIVTQQWTTRAAMNFPRFSAGGAVGPDGRWYVFGGINSQLNTVSLTEVYDPATDTWEVLDSRYSVRRPGRAWVRGAFASNGLWIFGGEQIPGNLVVPLVERLAAPGTGTWLPIAHSNSGLPLEPNDTLEEAMPIGLGQTVAHTFGDHDDFFDVFVFNAPVRDEYIATLTQIPAEHDYDVYIYSRNKLLVGHSDNIGNQDESAVTFTLDPGNYYVMVLRAFGEPGGEPYRLVVRAAGQ